MDKEKRKIVVRIKGSQKNQPGAGVVDDADTAGVVGASVADAAAEEVNKAALLEESSEIDEDDSVFLSPDEMIRRSSQDLAVRVSEITGVADGILSIDKSEELIEVAEEGDSLSFLTPEEMLYKTAGELLSDRGDEAAASGYGQEPFFAPPDNLPGGSLVEEMVSMGELDSSSIMSGHKMAPSEMSETEDMGPEIGQIDTGPITTKSNVLSPDDMLNPDELDMREEFVSQALMKGSRINDRFQVVRIITEQKDRNTYYVKDFKSTGKHFILKEIIPPPMSKAEYRERRNIFNDTIRILNTFNHPNLIRVFEGFSENNRDYYFVENVEGLDLVKLNEMNTKHFTEKEVIKWGLQLCNAAEFLHFRPVPFTLGEIEPRHIMVDDSGKVKIIGYDLQRFFDVNRTLAYLPDNPTTLYEDVAKIARILFFLLTKSAYDDDAYEIEWPDHVGEKMKRLMETACKRGQRTYGDIRVFAKKLEETQIEDKPETLRKRWGFDFTRIDFSWINRGVLAVINQKPYMIVVEILFIVFLLLFSFFSKMAQAGYKMPKNKPLAYITTKDTLFTLDLDSMEILDQRPINYPAGECLTLKADVPRKDDKRKTDRKPLLLVASRAGRQIYVYDISDNSLLSQIPTGNQPHILHLDKDKGILWVLHNSNPMVLTVDAKTLKPSGVVPLEDDPSGIIKVSGEIKTFPRGKEPRYRRGKLVPFTKEKNQIRGLVINSTTGKSLTAVNLENSEIIGNFRFEFVPGRTVFNKSEDRLYILDENNRRLVPFDAGKKTIGAPVNLPEREKDPVELINEEGQGDIYVLFKGTNRIAPFSPKTGKFRESIYVGGIEPFRMIYRKAKGQIWILNGKTKNISVLDINKGAIVKDIKLGKAPFGVCFFEGGDK